MAIAWLDRWLEGHLPSTLDGLASRNRVLTVFYVLGALMAVSSTARVSIFIGDPTRTDQQALPGNAFAETHSCLTAYVRASELGRQSVANLYEDPWWYGSLGLPPLPPGVENPYHPLTLDNFSYPPPFLLLMTPLAPLEGDFYAQRALWFGLNGIVLGLGLWIVARWIDGPGAHRTLLLAPLFFGSLPILLTLQIGNFHIATVVLSVLAMVAFDRGRSATGGALLALTILSKISPGVLGIVLLVQRRFRSAAWAAGLGEVLVALSVFQLGMSPITSFLTFVIPRLSSGSAFPFMTTAEGVATNMSPFGIAFKLPLFGIDVGDPWALAPLFARVYTGLIVLLAIAAARREGGRIESAVSWMSLLTLAALQSPFSPAYGTLALLWATTLLAAQVRSLGGGIGLVLIWVLILVVVPNLSPVLSAAQSLVQTAMTIGVSAWLILRVPSGSGRPDPARAH